MLAAALYLGRNLILGNPVRVVTAARGPLVQTVVASGRIITPQRVAIGATITERVARIPVDEGQTVKKGEVLIALDDSDERAALAQAAPPAVGSEQATIVAGVNGGNFPNDVIYYGRFSGGNLVFDAASVPTSSILPSRTSVASCPADPQQMYAATADYNMRFPPTRLGLPARFGCPPPTSLSRAPANITSGTSISCSRATG